MATDSVPSQRQSLLNKYDIPIDHLDFSYVESCKNVKELEKIIKILRSREEGHFPDLLVAAEKRLEKLDPANRLLRVEGILLNRDTLDPQYWKQIYEDVEKWSNDCANREKDLLSAKSTSSSAEDNFPPIRRPPKKMEKKENSGEQKSDKITSFDYAKWDKFDADAECLKMDLEEEKRQQEPPVKKMDLASELETLTLETQQSTSSLSKTEKELLANKEKELGNEFYKMKEFNQAVKNYTKSIAVLPTSFAYNNRAASFLNLEYYELAVMDINSVLKIDPNNVKAFYRRAQAYEKLCEFTKALSDLNSILKLEPGNNLAKSMKDKLKNKKTTKPKSSAKRSKLTLDGNRENFAGSSGISLKSKSGDGQGEPVAGPSGVNIKRSARESKPTEKNEASEAKRGMRKVDVLEVERDDSDSPFNWKRYWMEGRSAKVEVASKFREKARREPHPSGNANEPSSSPSNKSNSVPCNNGFQGNEIVEIKSSKFSNNANTLKPFHIDSASNFTQSWDLLTRERAPISDKARLLRSVRPNLLQTAIGNKLEEEMLSDFLCCLRNEFELKTECQLILEYLMSIARLERFNIIKTFLPTEIKQVIQELMDGTNAYFSLRKLYM